MTKTIADEICHCGHSKKCHGMHQLDNHGAECNQCTCREYTWKVFIFCEDLMAAKSEVEGKK